MASSPTTATSASPGVVPTYGDAQLATSTAAADCATAGKMWQPDTQTCLAYDEASREALRKFCVQVNLPLGSNWCQTPPNADLHSTRGITSKCASHINKSANDLSILFEAAKDSKLATFAFKAAYQLAAKAAVDKDMGRAREWRTKAYEEYTYLKTNDVAGKDGVKDAERQGIVDCVAELEYLSVNEEARANIDYVDGAPGLRGNVRDAIKGLDDSLGVANGYAKRLDGIDALPNVSRAWRIATRARRASLYEALYTRTSNYVPIYFTPKQDALLKKLDHIVDQLDQANQTDKADQVRQQLDDTRDQVRSKWRSTRDEYFNVFTQKFIRDWELAIKDARGELDEAPLIIYVRSRLAYYAFQLGNDKLNTLAEGPNGGLFDVSLLRFAEPKAK
jgi:hypothetical protein